MKVELGKMPENQENTVLSRSFEEDEDVTTVTFKNVKKGTYYLSLRKWNRTADNNEKVFGPWAI